jgi:hypothetical protein
MAGRFIWMDAFSLLTEPAFVDKKTGRYMENPNSKSGSIDCDLQDPVYLRNSIQRLAIMHGVPAFKSCSEICEALAFYGPILPINQRKVLEAYCDD